jgi:intracellular multiplication protein IcmL
MAMNNDFYRNHYHHVFIILLMLIVCLLAALGAVIYEILNRPLPAFTAIQKDGKTLTLMPFDQPNLLPDTILRWASKAAVAAYTFDFANYQQQITAARPYFTEEGWESYRNSISEVVQSVKQGQLFVNGIVSGVPVISNQGNIPGKGNAWRVQMPFLGTYQVGNRIDKRNFYVLLSIVQVPTTVNKQAIGIDQFIMR